MSVAICIQHTTMFQRSPETNIAKPEWGKDKRGIAQSLNQNFSMLHLKIYSYCLYVLRRGFYKNDTHNLYVCMF